jgi:hypothetical protein
VWDKGEKKRDEGERRKNGGGVRGERERKERERGREGVSGTLVQLLVVGRK